MRLLASETKISPLSSVEMERKLLRRVEVDKRGKRICSATRACKRRDDRRYCQCQHFLTISTILSLLYDQVVTASGVCLRLFCDGQVEDNVGYKNVFHHMNS